MRLVCPACSATYDVPDSLVTIGRLVRCARCGGQWTPVEGTPIQEAEPAVRENPPPPPARESPATVISQPAPKEPAAAPIVAPPRESAMDRLASHPATTRSRLPLRLAWAASFLLLVAAAFSAYAWRSEIVEMWPPSARMFAAFGMTAGSR
jgi:predicted Zn finger-like uncharacterized protein